MTNFFSTDAVCGVCDKYQVWEIPVKPDFKVADIDITQQNLRIMWKLDPVQKYFLYS